MERVTAAYDSVMPVVYSHLATPLSLLSEQQRSGQIATALAQAATRDPRVGTVLPGAWAACTNTPTNSRNKQHSNAYAPYNTTHFSHRFPNTTHSFGSISAAHSFERALLTAGFVARRALRHSNTL